MNILIIDDDAGVRYTLSKILVKAGHQVTLGDDGALGLALFCGAPPDLVITDLIMPRQGGLETIIQMRRLNPTMRILAMSGGGRSMNADALATALEVGADDVIIKPFDPEDLLNLVSRFD